MKRVFKLLVLILSVVFFYGADCNVDTRTGESWVRLYNNSEIDIIVVTKLTNTPPEWDRCKNNSNLYIPLGAIGHYDEQSLARMYILEDWEDATFDSIMEGLEGKYIQKYILTYDEVESLKGTHDFSFPPNEKMQGIEMDPPLN